VSDEAALATVTRAYELGLHYFDTAPLYGYGSAERRLGEALSVFPRSSFALSTKVGRLLRNPSTHVARFGVDATQTYEGVPFYKDTGPDVPYFDFTYDGAMRSIDESLSRLDLDYVDLAHVHDPEGHLDQALNGACRALRDLRDQGVVGAVGVGTDYSNTAVRFIEEADIDCVLIAGRWTLLDHDAMNELLPRAASRGVPVIAAGVFNSGVLASSRNGGTFDYTPCPTEIRERAAKLEMVCGRFDVPLKAAALQFPFSHSAVVSVVVGARSPEEIEENVHLADLEIPEELWHALNEECGVLLVSHDNASRL
jgi:D-threo-aldose 1-dehydrogenase